MKPTERAFVALVVVIVAATGAVWLYFWWHTRPPRADEFIPGTLVINSHEAILGAIGYKEQTREGDQTRWFFERMAVPAWKSLRVHNAGAVTRTESDIRRLEKLGLSTISRAFLETKGSHDSTRGYRLVTLQILDAEGLARELLELSRTNGYIRSILRQRGVRIVREVDQVFDHKTTEKLQAKTGASVTIAKARDTDVQLSIEAARDAAVTISDGSVVSYRLARLCWATDGTLHLRLDHGPQCPAGFSETLPDTVEVADVVKPAEPAIAPKRACPNIAGWWVRETDGSRLRFEQEDCTISADAPAGPFGHTFRGLYTDQHFQYVVRRKDNANGCITNMYGHIEVLDPARIRVVVAATDGKCELPANFWEDLNWRREQAVEPPAGSGP